MENNSKTFYSVAKGFNRGVYSTYKECLPQINGFRFPKFRKFNDYDEALRFAFPERYPLQEIEKQEAKDSEWIVTDKQKAHELEINYLKLLNRDEIIVIPKSDEPIKLVNIWISGYKGKNGLIGVFFGDCDSRNFLGFHLWKGNLTSTRLRLSACIKAIEILESPCTAVIHTENFYLAKALIYWTKEWFSRDKDKSWSKSEPNHDLLESLCRLSFEKKVKILPVCCNCHDENMLKISNMLSEYNP